MTKATHQDVNEIAECQTHFCLISDQSAANFLPIVYFRPARVVFVVTPEKQAAAQSMKEALKKACPGTKIEEPINIKSANDVNETLMQIWGRLEECKEKNLKPIVNITGGTKPMAIAALRAASSADCPAFYLYLGADKSVITLFQAGKLDNELQLPAIEFKPKLEYYLMAYGYSTLETQKKQAISLSQEKLELICELVTKSAFHNTIPFMNKLATEAKNNGNRTKGLAELLKKPDNKWLVKGVESWIQEFERAGFIQKKGEELQFTDTESRIFAAGGWLEEYVAHCVGELGFKPWINLEVKKKDKNEFDVAFIDNGRLYIIECKTCVMSDNEEAQKYVYKFETLAKVGGLSTHLILVSYQKIHPAVKERAENNGIFVIEGNQIKNLKSYLKNAIR